jgi:hypothetical protein
LPAGEAQSRAAQQVAGQWATVDPKAAVDWVSKFPDNEARNDAILQVISTWANADPAAAGQWLGSLPAGEARDLTITAYVDQVASQSVAMALPWIDKISNADQRNSAIGNVAREWLQIDPKAAEAWLAKTPLPDELKAELLKQPPQVDELPSPPVFR